MQKKRRNIWRDKKMRKILYNEFTTDWLYMESMDKSWHQALKIPGYMDRLRGKRND